LNILTVNTSASRGGASSIAKVIHQGVNRHGWGKSIFISGRKSDDHGQDIVNLGISPLRFLLNVFCYRILGVEGFFNQRPWNRVIEKYYSLADVVHVHNVHGYYLPDNVLALLLKKPVVWTLHDHWLGTGRCASPGDCEGLQQKCRPCPHPNRYPSSWVDRASAGKRYRESLISNGSVQFVVPSRSAYDLFTKMGISMSRLHVIENPLVDFPNDIQTLSRQDARRKLGIPLDRHVVTFIANCVDEPMKGFEVLLEALSLLPQQHKWFLVVIGEVSSKLKREVNSRFFNAFFVGFISDRRMFFEYLLASDCLVNPSYSESFGLVNIEALAVGCPVLCSDLPIFHEFKHKLVRFFDPGDSRRLAQSLVVLSESNFKCEDLQTFYSATICEQFSEKVVVSRYMEVYRKVLKESRTIEKNSNPVPKV
jgi:putative colanic acid biosynthesis glycosyltransferase